MKESLNSDGQQFHQYQQHLSTSAHLTCKKDHEVGLGQTQIIGEVVWLMGFQHSLLMTGSPTTILIEANGKKAAQIRFHKNP